MDKTLGNAHLLCLTLLEYPFGVDRASQRSLSLFFCTTHQSVLTLSRVTLCTCLPPVKPCAFAFLQSKLVLLPLTGQILCCCLYPIGILCCCLPPEEYCAVAFPPLERRGCGPPRSPASSAMAWSPTPGLKDRGDPFSPEPQCL